LFQAEGTFLWAAFAIRLIKNAEHRLTTNSSTIVAKLLSAKGVNCQNLAAASTMKYIVGLFSKTSRHCSSLCRNASSARFAAVSPSPLQTKLEFADLSLSP